MDEELKIRIIKSKCMADMFVWLGFEYNKTEDGYTFKRTYQFDCAWEDIHILRKKYKKRHLKCVF
ncbi:hypothetical protein [Clostridium sp.]|uniref:hypothetical protein n=1 Tax=Clostridium sp. TaxID=1506 RepID=UPI0026168DE4|nr:hypothetical protein [Clostridium sp.]